MPCAQGEIKSGKLLIKRDGTDNGSRPLEVCDNYWSSPDLFIEGGPSNTQAIQGVAHTVKVRVKNISTTDPVEDIDVEAWVCDYTAGPLPTGQIAPPGRMTGFRGGTLGPGASAVIACAPTWTPTAAQVAINNGHLCLAANGWGELPQPDGSELAAAGILKICCDSHHAQCNISLIGVQPGGMGLQPMRLRAPKGLNRMPMLLEIKPITGKVGFGRAEKQLIRSHKEFGRFKDVTVSRRKAVDFFIEGDGFGPAREVELDVDAKKGKKVQIQVAVDPSARRHSLQLFDVTTADPRTGERIGGARLMVLAV